MLTAARVALAIGMLGSVIASAQEIATIGRRLPSFQYGDNQQDLKTFSVPDFRGSYLLFYFWRTNNAESVAMYQKLSGMEGSLRGKGVRLYPVCADTAERFNEFAKVRDIPPMARPFFGRGLNMLYGAMSEPFLVLADPMGRLIWRGAPSDRWEERLDYYLEILPSPAVNEAYIAQRFRDAERLREAGELGKAYSVARSLSQMSTDLNESNQTKAQSLMDKIEGEAAEWLKKAVKHELDGEKEKAAYIIAQISVRFGKQEDDEPRPARPPGDQQNQQNEQQQEQQKSQLIKDTESEMGRMFGDRTIRVLIDKEVKNARGELQNEWADQLERWNLIEPASLIYTSVVKRFEETEAAKSAEAAVERIKKDRKIQQAIATARNEELAYRCFDVGERLEKIQVYDQARAYYERAIKEYPKAIITAKARERLAKLPNEDKTEAASAAPKEK